MAVFMHGFLGSAWMYQEACDHLASLGFVVLNMNTEVGPWIDTDRLAVDAQAALHWMDAVSDDPQHWLSGMASDDPWTAMGHSYGGIAMGRLVGLEPRILTAVGFMPYEPYEDEHQVVADFDGSVLYLAGQQDVTSLPSMVHDWFASLDSAERGLAFEIAGAGHQAISDFEWGEEPMADQRQREVVLQLASDFLRAEVLGRPTHAGVCSVTSPATSPPRPRRAGRPDQVRIVDEATLQMGLAARAGSQLTLYAGPGLGSTDTEHGPVGLRDAQRVGDYDLATGIGCEGADLPAELAGKAWVQTVLTDETGLTLGAPLDVFGVGAPDAEGGPVDPPTADDAPEPGDVVPPSDPSAPGPTRRSASRAPGAAATKAAPDSPGGAWSCWPASDGALTCHARHPHPPQDPRPRRAPPDASRLPRLQLPAHRRHARDQDRRGALPLPHQAPAGGRHHRPLRRPLRPVGRLGV